RRGPGQGREVAGQLGPGRREELRGLPGHRRRPDLPELRALTMTLLFTLAVLAPADALFQYRFDTCSMLIVAAAGGVLAHKVTDASPRLRPALRYAGVVALLAAGGGAYTESDPAKPF